MIRPQRLDAGQLSCLTGFAATALALLMGLLVLLGLAQILRVPHGLAHLLFILLPGLCLLGVLSAIAGMLPGAAHPKHARIGLVFSTLMPSVSFGLIVGLVYLMTFD